MQLRCGSLSITTPVPFLANEFNVRSVLYVQVSMAAVNQIYVIQESMNGCKYYMAGKTKEDTKLIMDA